MVGSSILPVTIHNNKLHFLFGKEASLEDTPGWSDFGGGTEPGESIFNTALREGAEELTGFLGNSNELKQHIKQHGGHYHINQNGPSTIKIYEIVRKNRNKMVLGTSNEIPKKKIPIILSRNSRTSFTRDT